MRAKVALLTFIGLLALLSARELRAEDKATEESRQHFLKGQQFFDVGRWDEAAEEFEKAYSTRNDPTFIYNMAQSYRRKGDTKRALDLYKNYLIKAPKSPQRAEVEERISALQDQLNGESASKASAPGTVAPLPSSVPSAPPVQPMSAPVESASGAPAPQPTLPAAPSASAASAPAAPSVLAQSQVATTDTGDRGHGMRVAGMACGAAGVAAVVAGLVFSLEARSYSNKVETSAVFNPSDDSQGKSFATLQWVGYGVGVGLAVTGALLYRAGMQGPTSVALVPLPGGVGLATQGGF